MSHSITKLLKLHALLDAIIVIMIIIIVRNNYTNINLCHTQWERVRQKLAATTRKKGTLTKLQIFGMIMERHQN